MSKPRNKILVILGPTSSGKSDAAIRLAKKFHGEIISADSRQIYRGMDIGTGKIKGRYYPKKKAYTSSGIPHYMIDIVSPQTEYNVAKFKKQAEISIEDILRRGKFPIVCGGTGFWIQAIVDNVNFPEVKPDWELRKRFKRYSVEKLFAMLKKLDPSRAKTIDRKNKVRLVRAIEICKALKKVPKIPSIKYRIQNTGYRFLQIGIGMSREKLYKNIENRVKARFEQGMIPEISKLHKLGLSWKKIQSFGLAYFWVPLFLQDAILKEELIEKVIQVEKNYAKRQMTWFKRDKRIRWLKNYQQMEKEAKKFLK